MTLPDPTEVTPDVTDVVAPGADEGPAPEEVPAEVTETEPTPEEEG